jgi:SAM-dependent methyltransferase
LAPALVERAGVGAGARVLDVGCGPGALTLALSGVVGEPALVAAVDPSHGYASACRVRVPGGDVRVATAEALPFDAATFDAVLAQLVVNFMADAAVGVAEMRRVARPGSWIKLWRDAGLVDVEVGPVVVSAGYRDFDDLWAPFEVGVAPSGAFCVSLPLERRARLRSRFAERLGSPDGPFPSGRPGVGGDRAGVTRFHARVQQW